MIAGASALEARPRPTKGGRAGVRLGLFSFLLMLFTSITSCCCEDDMPTRRPMINGSVDVDDGTRAGYAKVASNGTLQRGTCTSAKSATGVYELNFASTLTSFSNVLFTATAVAAQGTSRIVNVYEDYPILYVHTYDEAGADADSAFNVIAETVD